MDVTWRRKWLIYRWEPMPGWAAEIWAAPGEVRADWPEAEAPKYLRALAGSLRGHPEAEVGLRQPYDRASFPSHVLPVDLPEAEQEWKTSQQATEARSAAQVRGTSSWLEGPYVGMLTVSPGEKLIYDVAGKVDEETEAADERGGHARVSGVLYGLTAREHVAPLKEWRKTWEAMREGGAERVYGEIYSGPERKVREKLKTEARKWKDRWRRTYGRVLNRPPQSAKEQELVWREYGYGY
jgi:hypothetical protein